MWALTITWRLSYVVNYSHLNPLLCNQWTTLNQIWMGWSLSGPLSILCLTALSPIQYGMILGWSPFNIVSDCPVPHSRWQPLLKIEMYLWVYCCFLKVKMGSNFNSSYMAMSIWHIFLCNFLAVDSYKLCKLWIFW